MKRSLGSSFLCEAVKDGANTLAEMDYDAVGRRAVKREVKSGYDNLYHYAWSGWQCVEEYRSFEDDVYPDSGEIDLPWREYVYGNNIDELLQMRRRPMTVPQYVLSVHEEDKEITIEVAWAADVDEDDLIGSKIAIWDQNTSAKVYEITGNTAMSGGNVTVTVSDDTGLDEITSTMRCVIIFPLEIYTYHADAQGNIVAISAEDGTILEKYAYDVYGRLTYAGIWNSGTQQYDAVTTSGGFVDMGAYYAASSIGNEIFFQGRRWDQESGLYYFRNRYYDPATGRFISRDPSGPVDGPNLYAFVNNSPMNLLDPMGLGLKHTVTDDDIIREEIRKTKHFIEDIEEDIRFNEELARILEMDPDKVRADLEKILADGKIDELKTEYSELSERMSELAQELESLQKQWSEHNKVFLEHIEKMVRLNKDATVEGVAGVGFGVVSLVLICIPEPSTSVVGVAILSTTFGPVFGVGALVDDAAATREMEGALQAGISRAAVLGQMKAKYDRSRTYDRDRQRIVNNLMEMKAMAASLSLDSQTRKDLRWHYAAFAGGLKGLYLEPARKKLEQLEKVLSEGSDMEKARCAKQYRKDAGSNGEDVKPIKAEKWEWED